MITEKLKSKSCGEISCDQCNDERLEAANKIEYLLIQNLRLQLDLDASCNAEELRQVRAENARLREAGNAMRHLTLAGKSCSFHAAIAAWDSVVPIA